MSQFFATRQGAAVLKHGIISRYAAPFAGMAGKWAPGKRVVLLDAYAGPGSYDDGSPGSPRLLAATADRLAAIRNVEGIYVEKDRGLVDRLRGALAGTDHRHTVVHGKIDAHLDAVLDHAPQHVEDERETSGSEGKPVPGDAGQDPEQYAGS